MGKMGSKEWKIAQRKAYHVVADKSRHGHGGSIKKAKGAKG